MIARMPSPALAPHGPAPQPDGLPVPRRYWAIAAILLAIFMSVLDSTITNVALPTIGRDLDASPAVSIWVINAYQLAILVLLLPLASLGEIVGYRRVSQAGLALFTLASLGCACAPSLLTLSMARVLQGVGAAGIMSVNAALVRFTYPHRYLGRALGINAFVVGSSAAVGPTVASAVLAVAQWRWLFGINVPIGIITVIIARYSLPQTERSRRPLNYTGALLYAGTFGLVLAGLQSLAHHAATPSSVALIVCGALLGLLMVRYERSHAAPHIPFDLLRIPMFSLSIATSVCAFIAQMSAFVSLPFDIQRMGHSAVETGLLMTPWPLAIALMAPIAGRLADRYPAGLLGGAGLMVLTAGLLLLAFFPDNGTPAALIWRMALCGVGFGLFQSPNNRAMLAAAPRARSGAAGGMLSTARLIGQTLGAAGVAILFRVTPTQGSRFALYVAAALAFVASLVSLVRLTDHKQGAHP
jgi:MFS transporter, DHA2 family, multidrug resistance protein